MSHYRAINPYLTVHNNGLTTTFLPTSTLAEACQHLVGLLETGVAKANDILSIVELNEDRVIYYNNINNSPEIICGAIHQSRRSGFWTKFTTAVRQLINQDTYGSRR